MSGEDFRSRLRRLRREEVPARARPAEEGPPRLTDEERLELRRRLGRKGARVERSALPEGPEPGGGARTLGLPARLVEQGEGDEAFALRRTAFARDHVHGEWSLAEVDSADSSDFALLTGDAALGELDLTRAIYLDTETTGLSGGAGTYVYMVGLGRFGEAAGEPEGFEVWQGFLREPAEERAMLAECAERIAASSGVVSFFGKSFDRHRMEDKMRLHGVRPTFDAVPHLDLYHPLRRLYKAGLADARLRTMESTLCGVVREDDLPGSYAPEAWFDYLAGRPHRLEGVFEHNLDDVLSLVTLAAHLGRTSRESRAAGGAFRGEPWARALGVSKSCEEARDRPRALSWLDLAIARVGAAGHAEESHHARGLRLHRADLLRLERRYGEAERAYRELLDGTEDAHTAPGLLELAKLLEHHRRDREGALECCRLAESCIAGHHGGAARARLERDARKRIERLDR